MSRPSRGTGLTGDRRIEIPSLKPAQQMPVETPQEPVSPYGPHFKSQRKSLKEILADRKPKGFPSCDTRCPLQ
jgi:hypothetical protein